MVAHMMDVTEEIMETDDNLNTTHLIVYVMQGHGGEAKADSPCTANPRDRYILNTGGLGSIGNILATVWVSNQSYTMRTNLLNWCNLVSISKKVVFYAFLVVRIY